MPARAAYFRRTRLADLGRADLRSPTRGPRAKYGPAATRRGIRGNRARIPSACALVSTRCFCANRRRPCRAAQTSSQLSQTQEYSRVMPVSALRADSSVVAEVRPSPNHNERRGSGIARHDPAALHRRARQPRARSIISAIRSAKCPRITSCCRTATSCNWSRKRGAPGTPACPSWAGETDINSCSIGIEIANPGHDHGYPDFPKRQIAAVTALCRSIFTRHRIPPHRVLAHSDVAPARKQDPGEKFPWKALADSGIGLWVKPAPIEPGGAFFTLGETNPDHRGDAGAAGEIRLRGPRQRLSRRHHARRRRRLPAPFPSGSGWTASSTPPPWRR